MDKRVFANLRMPMLSGNGWFPEAGSQESKAGLISAPANHEGSGLIAFCESPSVVERHLAKLSGTTVKIELQDKAERRRRSATWENRAMLNRAKDAKQNGCTDKKKLVDGREGKAASSARSESRLERLRLVR